VPQDGGANYHRGTGWYRKHFTPSAKLAGKRLWLQFDGVNQVADVWVNGVKLGQHRGGFAGFRDGGAETGGRAYTDTAIWTLG
jgi:beta-galactosidase